MMENTNTQKQADKLRADVKTKLLLEQDKGKSLDEIYHDTQDEKYYRHYLRMKGQQ